MILLEFVCAVLPWEHHQGLGTGLWRLLASLSILGVKGEEEMDSRKVRVVRNPGISIIFEEHVGYKPGNAKQV